MDRAREICSTGSSLRKAQELRARLPLGDLTLVVPEPTSLEPFRGLIQDELNVKASPSSTSPRRASPTSASASDSRSTPAPPARGSDRTCSSAIKGSKSGDWSVSADGVVTSGGLALVEGEYALETVVAGGAAEAMPTAGQPRCCRAGASSCSTRR